MIVALFALVIASSGTAFAAQAALIPGSRIVAHSITAKQLAPGAVNHAALGSKAVLKNNYGGPPPRAAVAMICPGGIVVFGGPCPAVGAWGSALVTIPAGGFSLNVLSGITDTGIRATANPSPGHGEGTSPNRETQIASLNVQMTGEPVTNWPSAIIVGLLVNGVASSSFCTIQDPTPGGSNECRSTSKVTIPANSSVSFLYGVLGKNAPLDPTWDEFELSVSYLNSGV